MRDPAPSPRRSGDGRAPTEAVVVVGVHAAQRRAQAEELARQSGAWLVPAEDWGEDGLVPAHALCGGSGALVLEVPTAVPVAHVIGELADEVDRVRVTAVVAVACLHTLQADLASVHARALVDCLEAATHHALVGVDAETDGRVGRAGVHDDTDARRIVAALRPDALPVGVAAAGAVGAEIDCAGWLRVLNDEWPEDRHVPGIGVARYERIRPFHRGRLDKLAERWELEAVARGAAPGGPHSGLRISGLCRVGDRPEWTWRWDQVGADLQLHPLAADDAVLGLEAGQAPGHGVEADDEGAEPELLCLGPDLALFGWGAHVDLTPIVADLDGALLTDAEFAAGPDAWG